MTTEVDTKLASLTAWVAAGLCFILVFAISVMGVMVWQAVRVSQNAEELKTVATETHDSLCAFKADLDKRHTAGEQFLKQNPDGIPGISAVQIQQSLNNQQDTLNSLATLDCE